MTDFNKGKDLEFFEKWQQTKAPEDLGNLVKQFDPLMFKFVKRTSGSVPPAALSAEAKKQTIKAIESYNPAKGAALSTHVYHQLQKLKRMNYKYQNAVRMPENQTLSWREFDNSVGRLTEALGRDPTDDELASDLGWAKKEVKRMRERQYSDLYESGSEVASPFTKFDNTQILKTLVEENLDPQEQMIWSNVQLPKPDQKSVPDMAKDMGINVNRFQYVKSKMVKKIQRLQNELGDFD